MCTFEHLKNAMNCYYISSKTFEKLTIIVQNAKNFRHFKEKFSLQNAPYIRKALEAQEVAAFHQTFQILKVALL